MIPPRALDEIDLSVCPDFRAVMLDPEQAEALLATAELDAPSVSHTVFNTQTLDVTSNPQGERRGVRGREVELQPVVSPDRKFVRMGFRVHGPAHLENDWLQAFVPDGQTVLINVADPPSLMDIPYVKKLFKDTPAPDERTWLLVTPTILAKEEPEALIGLDFSS